ncbi:MAG: alpha-galactosidase [Clostridia bacterium]|nr:alpha-galactosidase [Clostridia bacterium]
MYDLRTPHFSFLYGGKRFFDLSPSVTVKEEGNQTTTVYTLEDGLTVTTVATRYEDYDAVEWVNWFENKGSCRTPILSAISDSDVFLPIGAAPALKVSPYKPTTPDEATILYAPHGSDATNKEFFQDIYENKGHLFYANLYPGQSRHYENVGGRSSDVQAPFFHLHYKGKGTLYAVGWTGQWRADFTCEADGMRAKSGLCDTHFYLLPGEKIRTSSTVLFGYEGTMTDGQNLWRRFLKKHFCPVNEAAGKGIPPISFNLWGGMTTKGMLERLDALSKTDLKYDAVWIDAGWNGDDTEESPDEFCGNWAAQEGSLHVNPLIHPDGMKEVSAKIHEMGMKFVLWFEPERARENTEVVKNHPEFLLTAPDQMTPRYTNYLVNLGDEEALRYTIETVSKVIEELKVDWYRQDYNIRPLSIWRYNDSPDRKGLTEIKYVMGLYRYWDALLARFPHLAIDNCAGGGRRIDIETMRRSVPLWRSDAQCPAEFPAVLCQNHMLSFGSWMPYSSTGGGRRAEDLYRFRSAFGSGLDTNFAFSERDAYDLNDPKIARVIKEARLLRSYFDKDIYPLTQVSESEDVWSAVRFDSPEEGTGAVLAFRRARCPYEKAVFPFDHADEAALYTFTDIDNGESYSLSGEDLAKNGFSLTIDSPRASKIFLYEKANKN